VAEVSTINPGQFVESVKPLLERRDLEGLLCHLKANYTPDQITSLLSCTSCSDARKVAALALSLVGAKCCIRAVSDRLRDKDPMTNQMAEHALWSIWFRCGCPAANAELARGADCLSDRRFECAYKHFNKAIELSPDFAEAFNQRAIAHYLQERYEESLDDCKRAAELMPCHFGAWAGQGHCYAHLGNLRQSLLAYEKALAINPHLDCIRQAVKEIRRQLSA
jgi:tetratricopeptide (TPR) repeat protein